MDLKRLRYFCAIVEHGQISRAAKALHISQPPLSQRLKELEEDLETVLIVRDEGRWEVTEAGRLLYEKAGLLLAELDNLKREVVDSGHGIGGPVSIGVSTTCETRLLTMLPELHGKYPEIRFRLAVADSSLLEKDIRNRDLDIAILLLPLEAAEEYEVRHLPPEGFSVVFGPSLDVPEQESFSLDDLLGWPLLLSRRWGGGGSYEAIMSYWQRKNASPQVLLDSHNIHTLLRLVELGMPAVAVVPGSEITETVRRSLRVRPLTGPELRLHPLLITKKNRFASRAAQRVAEEIFRAAWQGQV